MIKVTIVDPPPEGKLLAYTFNPWLCFTPSPTLCWQCDEIPVNSSTKEVTIDTDTPCYINPQVWIELRDSEDYLLYKIVTDKPTGVKEVKVYGWNGAHYRTTISVDKTVVKPGESFRLRARLLTLTNDYYEDLFKPVGENYPVEFYRIRDGVEEFIGRNYTDENGFAVLTVSESLPEDVDSKEVEYYAKYPYDKTYYDTVIVTVSRTVTKPIQLWDSLVNAVADLLGISREQADILLKVIIGLIILSIIF